MKITKTTNSILNLVFRDFSTKHTVTSISKEVGMTRQGTFNILKKLESDKIIFLSPVGSGRTSTYIASLNWENPILEKMLAVILTEEAMKNQRWVNNFAELEGKTEFTIIYGSILENPKEANDIDVISALSKKNIIAVEKIITDIQKTQIKKIHSINFTESELKNELKKQNKAFIDAIKKGIVLFGQDKFIKFLRELSR